MAGQTLTYENIRQQLKAGKYAPVYLLNGEEGYFIDMLVNDFAAILPEDEREFNQYVLYGPQVSPLEVIDICRRYPMMAERQVVILKEAQAMRADQRDALAPYIENPSPQTILVISCRGAKATGAKMLAALKKCESVTFNSAKIPEWKIGDHIKDYINSRGLNVQPKAMEMLKEYIGTDLSRLYNELDKLISILGTGATVTPESIERNIGVSKDYNTFELVDALAAKDFSKAMRIARYLRANPKATAMPLLTASIFGYFSDLMITYFLKDKSERGIMQALGMKYTFPMKRINAGRAKYNAFQVIEVIRAIRAFDCSTKGIGSRRDPFDLLDELIFRIVTAPGTLFPKY